MVLALVLGALSWGGVASAQNDCFRDPNSPTGCTNFCPTGQDCLPSAYGCNVNQPGTCGVQACDCNCHIFFDAASQPFCQGGCPDGTPCQLIGNGSTTSPWECTCEALPCPLSPGNWCQGLQNSDCVNGVAGEVCWPSSASISTAGLPTINSCECVSEGCGKMAVQPFADGTFAYRCLDTCPDPTQPCVIYKNGQPTTSGAIHSSQISPADDIRCGCKEPPPAVCPLETGTKICESVQAVDCQDTGTGDICRPDVVVIGPNGQVEGKRCDCFPDNATCGPVLVIELPAPQGTQISCDVSCPDPTVEQCHIYRNGFSTGLISAPASNFAPGDELSCACDPNTQPVCPLEPNQWCHNLQNINCRDGAPGEECVPTLVTVGFTGGIDICACDCQTTECQEVTITPDPTGYRLTCDNACPSTAQQCVIFINNAQTNLTSIHSSQVLGQYVSCDCADAPPVCPLPAGQSWCAPRQTLDCNQGAVGDECWPVSVSQDAAGTPQIDQCACTEGGCGKISVTTFADGTFAYRCLDTCIDTSQPCVIFKNNVPWTSATIHSSQFAPGDDIRCDCKLPPPAVCPLQTGTKICESVQAVDCQSTTPGETCKPDVVEIGPNFEVEGKRCTCYPDDATCGPMFVIELPASQGGTQLSCDVNCPDPTVEECHIYRNGFSTGLISAPATSFSPGDELTCACDPIVTDVCPLTPTPWCQNLQQIMCRDGQPGEDCVPTAVTVDFHGGIDLCACECLSSECQEVTIVPDPAGYTLRCDNACLGADQQCVIFINGTQTTLTSIHSTQALGQYITCDCAEGGGDVCPLPPGQDWCLNRQTLDCHDGVQGEECWPSRVTVNTAGQPEIVECDCLADTCGPVMVTPFADGTYGYRCIHTCPNTSEPCVIFRDGVPTGSSFIHSSLVTPGENITCDCDPPPPQVCPLETFTKICEPLQATDCKDTTTGDVCKPEVVSVGPNGQVVAKRCECHFNDGLCGPMIVSQLPTGTFLSCDYNCPDPDKQCVIFLNGQSTGQIAAPSTAFPPDSVLWCDCDPVDQACPLQPGAGNLCQNLQNTDCQNGLAGQDCSPTVVSVSATGGIEAKQCDCMAGECEEMAIFPDPAGFTFRCVNQCPTPPGGNCVIHLDGVPTSLITIHSTQALGHAVSCDCAQPTLGACCFIDATGVSTCVGNVTAAWCAAVGGSFHLSALCTGNQACCKPDGTCEDLDPLCCADEGGVSQGFGTTCATPGICGQPCLPPPPPETQWCSNHLSECQDSAPGEQCKPIAFTKNPAGGITPAKCACILDDCQSMSVIGDAAGWTLRCDNQCEDPALICVIHRNGFATTSTSIHSTQFGATDVISCDCADPPLLGSCCYFDQATGAWNCQDPISSADCAALGGVFHPGQNCTGAMGCCLPDGTCQNMDPLCCEDAGGVTLPAGAICTGQTEACCDPVTGVCTDEERACCQLHGGIPQGVGTNCGMPGICGGDVCPLAPGEWGQWCNNFQTTDCLNGKDTEECWPAVVQVDPATGFPLIRSCDCMEHCGPVTIAEIGGTYQFHCEHQCELPGFECVIHYDGVSQDLHAVNATAVPPGVDVTCDCAPDDPTQLCPVPPNQPWCEQRQDIDCPQMSDDERCMPRVVSMTTANTLNVEQCECQGQECGPVLISQQPDGYLFRCPQLCDDPALKCLIHYNGVPQGVTYVHSNAVPANVDVTCDCNQVEVGMCCYLNAAGVYDCIDGVTAAQCPGTFHPNQTCTDSIVPCCLPDGTCQDLHPLCCQDFGGTPNPNQMCTGQTVACCDPVTGACQNMDSMCCATPVAGALCTGDIEACCLPDGTCADLERTCCYAAGGAPQGVGTACSDPGICQGDLCPLPPNAPWCDARVQTDCKDGQADEECKPSVVSMGPNNQLQVVQCDCQDADCGPVLIVPVASGYIFRCPGPCDEPGAKCRIHRDGVPTSVSSVHSSTVAPSEKITCDCVKNPQVCPLDPQLDICLDRQQMDCKTTAQGEVCKAKVVSFTTAGNPFAKQCDCFQNNGLCGPVLLFPAPPPQGGWNISCDQACPIAGEQCVIWRGNSPTGLVTAHWSMFAPDENLSCGCNPVVAECKPTPDGQACTPCPDPTLKCVPTLIQWNASTPGYRIIECGCTNKCHINPPTAAGGAPFCSDACPGGPFTLAKHCVKKFDPATGAWMCRCVPIIWDLDPADPTLRKNRYLSMSPGGGGALRGVDEGPIGAVRITLDDLMNPQPANLPGQEPPDFSAFEGQYRWAGMVGQFPADIYGNTFHAAGLSCGAMFRDYSVIGEFSFYGGEVIPSSTYSVQTVSEECSDSLDEPDCYSEPTVIQTARFGDIAAPFQDPGGVLSQPSATDIAKAVDVVKSVPGTAHKTLAQMTPNVVNPDRAANASDIAEVIDAVKRRPYHLAGPCPCPSLVICNPGTVCASNAECAAPATCVNGYCSSARDVCGRCTAP